MSWLWVPEFVLLGSAYLTARGAGKVREAGRLDESMCWLTLSIAQGVVSVWILIILLINVVIPVAVKP